MYTPGYTDTPTMRDKPSFAVFSVSLMRKDTPENWYFGGRMKHRFSASLRFILNNLKRLPSTPNVRSKCHLYRFHHLLDPPVPSASIGFPPLLERIGQYLAAHWHHHLSIHRWPEALPDKLGDCIILLTVLARVLEYDLRRNHFLSRILLVQMNQIRQEGSTP